MAIRIGSNISSIQAQRRLSDASSTLSKTYERLSSGQRINRASDDAAGLSIADSLGVGRRVFTQGIRNLNDGISALQIADSAVGELSQIVTRIRELAEQAANGSYSSTQRKAMDKEAKELEKEYFRISRSASFNGTNLFDGSLSIGLRLQGGFGLEGSIQSSLGGVMGDGTLCEKTSGAASTGIQPSAIAVGDLNGDGELDMVSADGMGAITAFLGRGDGSFFSSTSFSVGANSSSITLGDLNGDGVLDVVTADLNDNAASVLLGKGDGSFSARVSYSTGAAPTAVALGDVNGDGVLDMIAVERGDNTISVLLGSGDGTFSERAAFTAGSSLRALALGDLNRDGALDIVVTNEFDMSVSVFLGGGDGNFSAGTAYATNSEPVSIALGDLNGDGVPDIVTADRDSAAISVLLGRGDGAFSPKTSYSAPGAYLVALGDLNADGALDIFEASDSGAEYVFFGRGNGSFSPGHEYAVDGLVSSAALGDLNGDGVLDVFMPTSNDPAHVLLGGTRDGIAPLLPFSLMTQSDALQAMAPFDRKLAQLAAQRGVIGAFQSRLSVAINTLQSTSENYASAESRIRDADIASDAAELTRLQISQQAATAVLAQANQAPALAIQLLRGG